MSKEAVATCRNSVQGRESIADDRGFVCDRSDLLASGCCDANSSSAGRFICASCDQVCFSSASRIKPHLKLEHVPLAQVTEIPMSRWLPVVDPMKIA